jgi:hypothetical protein
VIWPLVLFAVTLAVLRRKSLDLTVASALLVGIVNLAVIIIVSLLTLPHVRLENLLAMNLPFVNGRPFDPGLMELVFGVVLAAYAGHTSVGNMAKTVLRRDPSGRTLLGGNVAAMLTVMLLYVVWIIVVNGAIPAATLAATTGTALIPLAAVVGRSVDFFGTIFILLGMGMASLHFSVALFNQVRELLPAPAASTTSLRTIFHHRTVQFWLAVTPVAVICLLNMWLLFSDNESFSRPLGLVGALVAPVICGVFPVLLLAASRRKGDFLPTVVWRWLGNPFVLAVIYLIFLAGPAVHGLFIWQNPVERIAALVVCFAVVGCTILMIRRGSFQRRRVVEVRQPDGPGDRAVLTVVENDPGGRASMMGNERKSVQAYYERTGQPVEITAGELPDFSRLTRLQLRLPATHARELKVWTHQVLATGDSVALSAQATIRQGGQSLESDLARSDGQWIAADSGEGCDVEIAFASADRHAPTAGLVVADRQADAQYTPPTEC